MSKEQGVGKREGIEKIIYPYLAGIVGGIIAFHGGKWSDKKQKLLEDNISEISKAIHKHHLQDLEYYKEKLAILEEEREKWWSKAESPDQCYITMEGHKKDLRERLEGLKFEIYPLRPREEFIKEVFNQRIDQELERIKDERI